MEPEYVETQPTSTPHFDGPVPHPSSPAGQVRMWGVLARRVGPARIRAVILGGILVVLLVLVIESIG